MNDRERKKAEIQDLIRALYAQLLGRSPLQCESQLFGQLLFAGRSLRDVRLELMDSHEYRWEISQLLKKKLGRDSAKEEVEEFCRRMAA